MGALALLDTNLLVAMGEPGELAPALAEFDSLTVSSLSFSELAMGLYSTTDLKIFNRRLERYEALTAAFAPGIPFDDDCVRCYRRIMSHIAEIDGNVKAKHVDRMIAATAMAHGLTVVTRDLSGFAQLAGLVSVRSA